MRPALDHSARERILEAVRAAERRTGAEIRVVVLSRPLIRHPFYPVLWAALAALALPWIIAVVWPMRPIPLLALQGLIFLALAGLLSMPSIARYTIPAAVRRAAARGAALDRFLTLGIHLTESRTGLMILAAIPDRMVEVVADDSILARLGPQVCEEICAVVSTAARAGDLAGALVAGVDCAGQRLCEAFPRTADDRNELPDHVVFA